MRYSKFLVVFLYYAILDDKVSIIYEPESYYLLF
jgi:hypothetical protein